MGCESSKEKIGALCYNNCPEGMWRLYNAPWWCVNGDYYCKEATGEERKGSLVMYGTESEEYSSTFKTESERLKACPTGTELVTVSKIVNVCNPAKKGCELVKKEYTKKACGVIYQNETCCTPGSSGCEGTSLCTTSTTESINSFYNKQIDYS